MAVNPKGLVIFVIFLVFILPGMISAFIFIINPSTEELPNVIEKLAVPWEIGIFQWIVETFNNHPYIMAGVVIGFILFLKWIDQT